VRKGIWPERRGTGGLSSSYRSDETKLSPSCCRPRSQLSDTMSPASCKARNLVELDVQAGQPNGTGDRGKAERVDGTAGRSGAIAIDRT
jgi:hypothetical protein